jgi:hypothetical protein
VPRFEWSRFVSAHNHGPREEIFGPTRWKLGILIQQGCRVYSLDGPDYSANNLHAYGEEEEETSPA